MYNFEDKVVLVVGSSRGIGRGVCNEFIHKGADVIGISRYNCDISKQWEVDEYFSDLELVDILVNVAAINYSNKIEDVSFSEWTEVIDVNLRGYYYIIKKTLDIMPDGGKIVNVSSIAGRHRSYTSGVHYTASKAGIIGLTKQVAFEVAGRGINVNAVCPSQTKTDMLLETMTEEEIKKLEEVIPMGRLAEIDEVVNPIIFLCSDDASYITGTTLDINGGQL
jgi:3-oxoacyl-[acyl-carrier protein] reductase